MGTIPNKLHKSFELFNVRPVVHILMQEAAVLNTFHIVRKFLAEQWVDMFDQWDLYSFHNQQNCY
jgi:hypothetical protein